MITGLLDITGKIHCLAISDRLQATRFIYGSIVCSVAGYVLMVGQSALVADVEIAAYYRAQTTSLRDVLIFAAYMLLLIFMRRLAEFIGSPQLAREARRVLSAFIVAALLYVGSVAALRACATLGLNKSVAAMTVSFVFGVVILVMFVRYANLITYLRRATFQHVASQAPV